MNEERQGKITFSVIETSFENKSHINEEKKSLREFIRSLHKIKNMPIIRNKSVISKINLKH